MFPLDPFEAMFDLDNNGILDETERATMYMFMQEQEAQEREKSEDVEDAFEEKNDR